MKSPLKILLYAFIAAALSAGCGGGPKTVGYLADDAVILAFGDSITYGTGAQPEQSYPSQLAGLTGYNVINAGVPGEVTADALKRLPGLLERYRPQLVVLCHGGNDMLKRLPPEDTRANLESMIDEIRASGAEVILIGVPIPGLIVKTAPLYLEIARSRRIPSEQKILAEVLSSSSLKYDQIHPNAEGYGRIAMAIARLLPKREGAQ